MSLRLDHRMSFPPFPVIRAYIRYRRLQQSVTSYLSSWFYLACFSRHRQRKLFGFKDVSVIVAVQSISTFNTRLPIRVLQLP